MTEIVTMLIIMLSIGLLAGAIGSILGIGGGLIVTPFLTIFFGLDIKYAIAASIVVVIATSSGSAITYLKDNVINLKAAMFLEIFTTIGGLIGAILTGVINQSYLYILFSFVLVFSIINTIRKIKNRNKISEIHNKNNKLADRLQLNGSYYDANLKQNINYKLARIPLGSTIMFGAGIMSGMLGIGSGIFKVIALDGAMKMPIKAANSTSNLMMGVTATASAILYFCQGMILPEIAVPVVIGVLTGAFIGSRIMPKLPTISIRIMFIIVALILSSQMIYKAVIFF